MEKGQEKRERLARSKLWAEKKRVYIGSGRTETEYNCKATKVKRYDNRIKKLQDNRNFQTNQGRFLKNLDNKEERPNHRMLKTQQHFGIWNTKFEHKQDAEWIDKAKEKMPSEKQNTVKITKDDVKRKLKSMPDWKGAGPDKRHGFWVEFFRAVHEVLATVFNECIEEGWRGGGGGRGVRMVG